MYKSKEIRSFDIYSLGRDFINCDTFLYMISNNFREKEAKRQKGFKVIYDCAMGVLWFAAGLFFLLNKYLIKGLSFDSLTSSIFGIVCLCYGVFRLYRGFSAKS